MSAQYSRCGISAKVRLSLRLRRCAFGIEADTSIVALQCSCVRAKGFKGNEVFLIEKDPLISLTPVHP
jgi:hypothetical protein